MFLGGGGESGTSKAVERPRKMRTKPALHSTTRLSVGVSRVDGVVGVEVAQSLERLGQNRTSHLFWKLCA